MSTRARAAAPTFAILPLLIRVIPALAAVCLLIAPAFAQQATQPPPAPSPHALPTPSDGVGQAPQGMGPQMFMERLASIGAFETEAARIGLARPSQSPVEAYTRTLIENHQKARARLEKLVSEGRPPLPLPEPQLTEEQRGWLSELQGANEADFPAVYGRVMIASHLQAVDLLRTYIRQSTVPSLREFARMTLPEFEFNLSSKVALRQRASVAR